MREILANREKKKTAPSQVAADVKGIAQGFFRWLRDFVDPYCRLKKLGSVESIPVRITIPSFGVNTANATLILNEILSANGWNMAVVDPVLAEPVANMIGTISGGKNWVWTVPKPPFQRLANLANVPRFRAFQGTQEGFSPLIYL